MALLTDDGLRVNRKRVRPLMRLMGIVWLGPKPRASQPGAGDKIDPYHSRYLKIDRAN